MTYRMKALTLGLFLTSLSCGGGDSPTSPPPPPPPPPPPVPTTVTVTSGSTTITAIGGTVQLTAQVLDQNGAVMSTPVTWSSSATGVATVSSGGLVTAAGPGTATITGTAGSASGNVTITVDQQPAEVGKVSGDAQTGVAGSALGDPVSVSVQDSNGNGVAGESVTFAVTSGGGSADPATATTGADGTASTTWTLGTDASQDQTLRVTAGSVTTDFTATAQAGPADALDIGSGDGQTGLGGAELPDPLVVSVVDEFGNPVSGVDVTWTAAAGSGTLAEATTTTGADGTAQNTWTLAEAAGVQMVTADIGGGLTVEFTATSTGVAAAPTITNVTALVEGGAATITGTNFGATVAANIVTVDGVAATITDATTTTLIIDVPSFMCQPARDVDVMVTSNGLGGAPSNNPLAPAAFIQVSPGEQTVLSGDTEYCIQLPENAAAGDYLIGVQSQNQGGIAFNSVTLNSLVDPGAAPVPSAVVAPPVADRGAMVQLLDDPEISRRMRHRVAHLELMERGNALYRAAKSAPAAAAVGGPPAGVPNMDVGQTATLNVRDLISGQTCNDGFQIPATVQAKTAHTIWYTDDANPANGYTQAQIQALAQSFEDQIWGAQTAFFGPPTDIDNNERIAIFITQEVNKAGGGLLGFVNPCDFIPQAQAPNGSNEGEIFYLIAPDPTGMHATGVYTVADALDDAILVLAHEQTHITQAGRRDAANNPFMDIPWAEGQATAAEHFVGHADLGNQTGQNYGIDLAFDFADAFPINWYSSPFADFIAWWGWKPGNTKAPGAPELCSWLDRATNETDICQGVRNIYGVPWSLFQWITDQFFLGQEANFHQGLIDSPLNGFALIEAVSGRTMASMMPPWSAAIYLDDRAAVDPSMTFASWDFFDIFDGLIPSQQPQPYMWGFTDRTLNVQIRDGSTAYLRVSGANQPSTSIYVQATGGGDLPGDMVVYVVPIPN